MDSEKKIRNFHPPANPYKKQARMLCDIVFRRGQAKDLFGIEYVFLVFTCLGLMLMPAMFIRWVSGAFGYLARKITIELYAIAKPALLLWILFSGAAYTLWGFVLSVVLFLDLILYLSGIVFLKKFYTAPASAARSLLLLGINFVESCIAFAVFYSYFVVFISPNSEPIRILYFSFVTAATVGFGDLYPTSNIGRGLVITQILINLYFLSVFVATFVSNLNETGLPSGTDSRSDKTAKKPRVD